MRNAVIGRLDEDISIKKTVEKKESSHFFDEILNYIPAVQIREYAQDARLVQIQNAISAFTRGWEAFREGNQGKWKDFLKDVLSLEFLDKMFGKFGENVFKDAVNKDINFTDDKYKNYILNIPFVMYYQMMSSRTTGFYTLPYSGKVVDMSNGSEGWNTQHGFAGVGTSENTLVGVLLNFIGKNVKFNTTPTWDGNTTHDYPAIEVQFDLFNDTQDAALNNFVFLNHIMPKNRFTQYHIYQHNPCVYDVKIEGYGRFYMCSGSITCDYKGVSRCPTDEFFKRLANRAEETAFGKYLNETNLKNEKLVRIPDVYSFKLTLTSLLPNSLNNYLYRYSGNQDMEKKSIADFKYVGENENVFESMKDGTQAAFKEAAQKNNITEDEFMGTAQGTGTSNANAEGGSK